MNQSSSILTVSQLTFAIKHCLENTFPTVTLQGEVSNLRQQSSGHLYFSLKDRQAQIACVMFRRDAMRLNHLPKDGNQLIINGEVNVYPLGGKYQLVVRSLRLSGVGELLLKFEELKQKLKSRGLFEKRHKKPLPQFPKRIGAVTSPTGAAIQDILNVLTRRFSGFHLILNPVRVQGEEASFEIARAIQEFNHYQLVDVIIVGRGGGSIEDLWAFNEERVAEAIFQSKIPIISAVGHEIDHSIADEVADLRAPTPSAAAEVVIQEKRACLNYLLQISKRMEHSLKQLIQSAKYRLQGVAKHPFLRSPFTLLGQRWQHIDEIRLQLDQKMKEKLIHKKIILNATRKHLDGANPKTALMRSKQKLIFFSQALQQSMVGRVDNLKQMTALAQKQRECLQQLKRQVALKKERLLHIKNALESINPQALLEKGYSIVFSEKEHWVINSVSSLEKGESVRIQMADGSVRSVIIEKEYQNGKRKKERV